MTSEKLDRRKKYSRMVLKDSLLDLLKQKQFSAITVKEVCERADINRSTFYAHYADLYALLEEIEDEIINDMTMYLSTYNFNEAKDAQSMTEKLIEYFVVKQDELQVLLNENGETSFQKRVMEVVHPLIMEKWMKFNHLDQETTAYISTFIITGSVQVIKTWLINGMEKPPKAMAELINNLINNGVVGLDD